MRRSKLAVLGVAVVVAGTATVFSATALGGDNDSGFKTSGPQMLKLPALADPGDRENDVEIEKLLTVGDTLPAGYTFEAIPDGIGMYPRGNGRVDLYVNHETSTVPFPYSLTSTVLENNQNDFDNSQVSLLSLNQHSSGVLSGKLVITSAENWQRFCSNYLATGLEGFDRPILFTNEEAQDVVRRSGQAWEGPEIGLNTPAAEQPGVVVAYDVRTGKRRPIYGMGRHDHENSLAVPLPESGKLVLLSGDDSFMTAPVTGRSESWSQLYSYIADDTDAVWNDQGDLYAFVSDDADHQQYYDFMYGDTTAISGKFVKVPKLIATGKNPDGTEVTSSQFGMPAPPLPSVAVGAPVDGPNWVLDQWGNPANNTAGPGGTPVNVFRFIRVEDMAYDKRPGKSNIVYIVDSGLGSLGAIADRKSTNGRIWEMVLDPENPEIVTSLRILVEGDDSPVKTLDEIHQPDNVETTAAGSLLIQEDPGSSQQFVLADWGLANATEARIWRVDLDESDVDGSREVIARVDQAADETSIDKDGAGANAPPAYVPGRLGAWESSGVVDASSVFGPGWFFVVIQAHTLWTDKADGPDTAGVAASPDFVLKREGGQLLRIYVPDA